MSEPKPRTLTAAFNTGNAEPLRKGVLQESTDYLVRRGYEWVRGIKDDRGTYAVALRYDKRTVYLVARSATPLIKYTEDSYGGKHPIAYVSTQRWLINHAAETTSPILLSYWPEAIQAPTFKVYDSTELKRRYAQELQDDENDNNRFGIKMLNYEYELGIDVEPGQIFKVLNRIANTKADKKNLHQVTIAAQRETVIEQRMITCPICGALYSDKLDRCPNRSEHPTE